MKENEVLTYKGFKLVLMSTYSEHILIRKERQDSYRMVANIADAYDVVDEMTDGLLLN